MTSPLNNVQYLYQKNLQAEQRLQAGYFRDLINAYGVPVIYFRNNLDYYNTPSGDTANYIYGESPTSQYTISGLMNVFLKVDNDSPVLRRFGIETVNSSEIYFMKDDFTHQFRDLVGIPTGGDFNVYVSGNIVNFSGIVQGDVYNNELSGITSGNSIVSSSGVVSGLYNFGFKTYPIPYNNDLAKTIYYTERIVNGLLSGILTGNIDISGNGLVGGWVSGNLDYYLTKTYDNWNEINPRVGDFFRLYEFDNIRENFEEYEVTEILDKELTPRGLNPLLRRYIWRCSMVRRDPSHEIISSSLQKEKFTPNYMEFNNIKENISNNIFNYNTEDADNIDKMGMDSVYGSYGYT